MKRIALASLVVLALIATAVPASAHCQIPCGIYDDELRVQLIEEHITTIEKSMNQIIAIPKTAPIDYNQLVRWVNNKETHATEIQDIVTAYFMAQRIKPAHGPRRREGGQRVSAQAGPAPRHPDPRHEGQAEHRSHRDRDPPRSRRQVPHRVLRRGCRAQALSSLRAPSRSSTISDMCGLGAGPEGPATGKPSARWDEVRSHVDRSACLGTRWERSQARRFR